MLTVLRHLLSILLLPVTVTIVVPYVLVSSRAQGLWAWPPSGGLDIALRIAGAGLIGLGLGLMVATNQKFATVGRGTLAPWDPPRRFVVAGVYRYVRNPMISGVLAILFGEAAVLRSEAVLEWALVFFLVNAVYIPLIEEPMLERRFGESYREYKAHVRRWLPRRTPWEPGRGRESDER